MKKLNLGCGYRKHHDMLNVDIDPNVNPDMLIDLNEPLPFNDEEFDEIASNHVIEHIVNLRQLMKECYRILKPGGLLLFAVPHMQSECAWIDPEHVHYFHMKSFEWMTDPRHFQPWGAPMYDIGMFKHLEGSGMIDKCDNPSWNGQIVFRFKKMSKEDWKEEFKKDKMYPKEIGGCYWCQHPVKKIMEANIVIKYECTNCGEIMEARKS